MRLDGIDRDVQLGGDLNRAIHICHTAQHLPLTVGKLLDDHRGGLADGTRPRCDPAWRYESGFEQVTVSRSDVRVTGKRWPDPAALHRKRKPEPLRLTELKRPLQRLATADLVTTAEADECIGQQRVEPDPLRRFVRRGLFRVRQ